MSYTLQDWFRDNAQVRVRVPAPPGYGKDGWAEVWLPFSVFDEGARGPEWMQTRTHTGAEAVDFIAGATLNEPQ